MREIIISKVSAYLLYFTVRLILLMIASYDVL